jgi:hypothetical protein
MKQNIIAIILILIIICVWAYPAVAGKPTPQPYPPPGAEAGAQMYPGPELRLLHAIPNGAKLPWLRDKRGQRFSPQAFKLKAEGLRSGVPDLCLPAPRKGYHGLYIELKHGDNKPTDDQVWWLDRLSEQGYLALVCWEADEAIEAIGEYLGIGK